MSTSTARKTVKVCNYRDFQSEPICGALSGNHRMQWCPLHPFAGTVEIQVADSGDHDEQLAVEAGPMPPITRQDHNDQMASLAAERDAAQTLATELAQQAEQRASTLARVVGERDRLREIPSQCDYWASEHRS